MNPTTELIVCLLLCVGMVAGGAFLLSASRSAAPFKYTIEIIDGCEYLRFETYCNDAITHKGNCKNHEQ